MSDHDRGRQVPGGSFDRPRDRSPEPRLSRNRSFLYRRDGSGARSLPSSIRLAASSLGGELVRMRSFFFENDPPAAGAAFPHPPNSAGAHVLTAPDAADADTRLEILKAPEINFTIFALYVATLFAILYVVVVTYIARASWAESQDLTKGAVLETFSTFLRFGINLGFLVLPLFFALRLGVARRVASEQLWIAALLFTGLFCENPLTDLLSSLATVRRGPVASSTATSPSASLGSVAKGSGHAARLVFYDATYTVVIYLYMLLSAHSYRILDAKEYTRSFYLPKLLACAAYFCVKLFLGYTFRIALGVVPFARPLALFYLNSSGRSSIRLTLPALVTTACDTCFAVWIAREVSHTARFLARVPYLENRGKQLGFRCFVFQSIQLITSMLIVSLLLEASLPREALYRSYDWAIGHRKRFIQIEPPVGQLALALVYFTWNVIIAYVNLPPGPIVPYTASGVRSLARVLPAPLLDRRLWPVWMPFAIATEPDDDDSETEEEDEGHLLRGVAGAANVSTLEGLSAQFEETTALEPAQVGVIANAVSWRAGTPKGESCPLRYRHREWHEQIPMPCASFDLSVGDVRSGVADNVYSGELGGADDSLLDYTSIRNDWGEGRVEVRSGDGNGSGFVAPLVASQSEPVAMPIPERPRSLPGFSPGADEFDSGVFNETTDADENGAQADFLLSLSPPPLTPCTGQGRLITRKNMFVMETQVTLANAMYLCYIPGNRNEELPLELRKGKGPSGKDAEVPDDLSSFAVGLDELEAEIRESENRRQRSDPRTTPSHPDSYQYPGRDWELEHDLGTGSSTFPEEIRPVSSVPNVAEADRQPERDDGTMFLVDPFEMAAKNGYLLYRHIRHDASNGHAIVLVGKDRVIVAFSGTRDRKNWATNSRFMRAPWDDMFRHFDSEPSDTSPEQATDPTARLETPEEVKPTAANLDSRSPEVRLPMNMEDDGRPSEFRSGPRSHALDVRFPGSRSGMHSARRHSMSAHGLESVETKALAPDRDRDSRRRREDATLARPALERGAEGRPLLRRSKSFESVRVHSEDSPSASGQSSRADPRSYGSVRIRGSESSARARSRQNDEEKAGSPWLPSLSRRHPRPGASEFEEVAVSLAQELATYGHCKVHLGFAQAYGKLRNRVMGALVELYGGKLGAVPNSAGPMDSFVSRSSPGAGAVFEKDADGRPVGVERGSCRGLPIFFVGHSLGGVLATFASYEAARYYRRIGLRRRQDVACTTFGSPMPGNSVFKQRYERMVETHWRFEFASDPVPKLPGILNYNPVGVRVLLDQSGWLMVDPSLVEVQWWGGLAGPYLGARLHIRASYIKALQVFCSRHKGGEDPIGDRFWPFPITCQTRNLFPTDL